MAAILNLIFAVLFLSLIGQGHCQCSLDNIKISHSQTGKTVENKPEWKVTISNRCSCSQSELKLSCNGFQTVETIDPSVLAKSGGECLVNNGQPVPPFGDFNFNYAWDTSFPFSPLSSHINCS
ncbi:TPD1 protein homolog 1-like [Durio zibethinus]|uniref:TPD1 protein homolog 1-like n=1 Tax=Durio zibethinus TaxID=66656 RepID=A0A6P5Z8L4_DURZI|nr:TPD1 protein homolog 1-like [Durio zibethinus]